MTALRFAEKLILVTLWLSENKINHVTIQIQSKYFYLHVQKIFVVKNLTFSILATYSVMRADLIDSLTQKHHVKIKEK